VYAKNFNRSLIYKHLIPPSFFRFHMVLRPANFYFTNSFLYFISYDMLSGCFINKSRSCSFFLIRLERRLFNKVFFAVVFQGLVLLVFRGFIVEGLYYCLDGLG